jgi:hypothetical protein
VELPETRPRGPGEHHDAVVSREAPEVADERSHRVRAAEDDGQERGVRREPHALRVLARRVQRRAQILGTGMEREEEPGAAGRSLRIRREAAEPVGQLGIAGEVQQTEGLRRAVREAVEERPERLERAPPFHEKTTQEEGDLPLLLPVEGLPQDRRRLRRPGAGDEAGSARAVRRLSGFEEVRREGEPRRREVRAELDRRGEGRVSGLSAAGEVPQELLPGLRAAEATQRLDRGGRDPRLLLAEEGRDGGDVLRAPRGAEGPERREPHLEGAVLQGAHQRRRRAGPGHLAEGRGRADARRGRVGGEEGEEDLPRRSAVDPDESGEGRRFRRATLPERGREGGEALRGAEVAEGHRRVLPDAGALGLEPLHEGGDGLVLGCERGDAGERPSHVRVLVVESGDEELHSPRTLLHGGALAAARVDATARLGRPDPAGDDLVRRPRGGRRGEQGEEHGEEVRGGASRMDDHLVGSSLRDRPSIVFRRCRRDARTVRIRGNSWRRSPAPGDRASAAPAHDFARAPG